MHYCKFCGTKLEDGKLCVCPEAAAERQTKAYVPPKAAVSEIPEGAPITPEMLGIDSEKYMRKSVLLPFLGGVVVVGSLICFGIFSSTSPFSTMIGPKQKTLMIFLPSTVSEISPRFGL